MVTPYIPQQVFQPPAPGANTPWMPPSYNYPYPINPYQAIATPPIAPPPQITSTQPKVIYGPMTSDADFRERLQEYDDDALDEGGPTVEMVLTDAISTLNHRARFQYDCECGGTCAGCSKPSMYLHDEEPFFRSSWVSARYADLPHGLVGRVNVSARPFEVEISRSAPLPRAQVSFVHELLHTFDNMLKLNLPHEQIHNMAAMLVSEVLPGLNAMTVAHNNNI
jgi:hypothetical protein